MIASRPEHERARQPALAELLLRIRGARRRLVAIAFLRESCVAGGLLLVGVAVLRIAGAQTALAGLWLALAATVGVTAVAISVWWRAPSMGACAAMLDRRLALSDRVVAAFTLRDDDSPVSALIVRDAARKLHDVSLPDLFPLRVGRLAVVLPLAGLLALTVSSSSPDLQPTPARGGAGGQSISAAGASGIPRRDGPSGGSDQVRAGGPEGPPLHPEPAAAPVPKGGPAAGGSGVPRRGGPLGPPKRDERTSQARAAQQGTPSEGGPEGPPLHLEPRKAEPAAGGSGILRSFRRGGPSGPPLQAVRAGGIAGGSVARTSPATRNDTLASADYAARYRAAASRAESAVSRDDVPPNLRGYVRDYFLAIKPTTQP